ncbi:hypothetical protein CJP74_07600 [Psittacicella melopsittaci]|uniref:Uncharacterized protein n=1 Tax=Psittacicella melopsittaci TaxID=2028576 RepID=A0A3A1XZ88_9GAMM|nr:glycosyl hydrolase family 28 protein [Psittacicella melopsittaci]RIY31342.1 hypothetical protein CJP74_07600 [Psittacicella melopsittaci]
MLKKITLTLSALGLALSSLGAPSFVCQTLTPGEQTQQNIQRIIDQCAETEGYVAFTPGTYTVSGLKLPAHAALSLAKGATLVLTGENGQSGSIQVLGDKVTISGEGTISGGVQSLPYAGKDVKLPKEQEKALKEQEKAFKEVYESPFVDNSIFNLPALVQATNVNNLEISGVSFTNFSGNAVYLNKVKQVTINQTKVSSERLFTHGIVVNGGEGVTLKQNYLSLPGIHVLIAAKDAPSQQVRLDTNYLYGGVGAVIGINLSQGVKQVEVNNLVVQQAEAGVAILTNARVGGQVSDISFNNIYVNDVSKPIYLAANFNQTYKNTGNAIPTFQNLSISNFYSLGGGNIVLTGYSSSNPLAVNFSNVRIAKVNSWKIEAAKITDVANSSTGSFSQASVDEVKAVIDSQLKPFPRYN